MIRRADMWALYMALGRLSDPTVISTDNLEVVQALRCAEESCIGPMHKDADWWNDCRGNTQVAGRRMGPANQFHQSSHNGKAEKEDVKST